MGPKLANFAKSDKMQTVSKRFQSCENAAQEIVHQRGLVGGGGEMGEGE